MISTMASKERHDHADQIDDAFDVQAEGGNHQDCHQYAAEKWGQVVLLSKDRAAAGQHHHTDAVQEK